jgi:hypothetical protein
MAEHERDEGAVEYGNNATTFDEMEAANSAPNRPDLSAVKLEGDDIPEFVRGKSVSEALSLLQRQQQALEISENARLALKNSQEALETSRSVPAPQPVATPAPEPEHSEQELRELYERDPFAYQQLMNERLEKRILGNVQSQIRPAIGASADLALRNARTEYADEFAALGPEIENMISKLPDKSVLANAGAIDDLVSYVRGKHVAKYIAHINSKTQPSLEDARRSSASNALTSFNSTPQVPRSTNSVQLDDTEIEVARALGVDPADYAKNKQTRKR